MGKRSAAGELILGNMGSRSSELSASLRTSTKRGCGRSGIKNPQRGRPALSGAMARSRSSRNHS
jgi:hypothetical protein